MNVYFISGLGADKKVFSRAELPRGYRIIHVEWIKHIQGESLQSYCQRLVEQIDTSAPFCLAGLSFGGIVAQELAKIKMPKKIIILSSISSRDQLPFYLKLVAASGLNRLAPAFSFVSVNAVTNWFFGLEKPDDKVLFRQIMKDSNGDFNKWSANQLLNWPNKRRTENLIHIHGSKDRIFPVKNIKPDFTVNGGGHFMVYSMAAEVNRILADCLPAIRN